MRSASIKDWKKTLSFSQIAKLEDFRELLTEAIYNDQCLLCDDKIVLKNGLCLSCYDSLSDEDLFIATCLEQHQVKTKIELPDKFPWEK